MNILLVAAAALSVLGLSGAEPRGSSEGLPNFIIIFADDLGYGDLGCQGHPTIRTPRLDRMAREGIRLTSFYAAPSCSPSRAALLTGRYPPRTGVYRVLGPDDPGGIPASEVLLPEALRARGYRTAAIGKWHLGSKRREHLPTENGFDEYFGLLYSNDMIPPWVETQRPLRLYRGADPIEGAVDVSTLTARYTEEALRFIRENRGRPFFLYLAHTMVHVPLGVSPEHRGKSRAGIYGDAVEEIDSSAGRILDALAAEGLDGRTLVVFTSDNGPWLGMPPRMIAGGVRREHAGSAGLLRGAKGSTFEGGVRVPCIVRWPGRIPPGLVSADMASTMDLYATILAFAGAEVPRDGTVDGVDLSSLLTGSGSSPRREFFYWSGKALEAVREGPWKLRIPRAAGAKDAPRPELYHLDVDPSERWDVAAEHPEVVERLRRLAEEHARAMVFGPLEES